MFRARAVLASLIVILGCGSDPPPTPTRQLITLSIPDGLEVTAPAGGRTYVVVTALGAHDAPVTFEAEGLPAFATLSEDAIVIEPARTDVGRYDVLLTATAGTASDRKQLAILVVYEQDPIVGGWRQVEPCDGGSYVCEFFANGAWNSTGCGFGSGWPDTWQRIGDSYFFGISNGWDCTGKATFPDGEGDDEMTLTVSCGTTAAETFSYERVR
jgi:hypothetical protein